MASKATSRCIFCGERANSREHLFPDWLNEVLPNYASVTVQHGSRTWQAKESASQRVAVVCEGCNTGWMSELERSTRPLIEPMMSGRRQALDKPQQQALAVWAFKTAAVGEQMVPATAAIPREQLQHLRTLRTPPPNSRVIIGGTDGRWGGELHFDSRPLQMTSTKRHGDVGPGNHNGYLATIAIRHLVLQVVGTVFEHFEPLYPSPLDRSLHRIWPFERTINWPPGPVLDPLALRSLSGWGADP